MKTSIFLVLLTVFSLSLTSCGDKRSKGREASTQDMETGFEMIDKGNFNEAILYFEALYNGKPSDDTLRAWASAYIARAGVKVTALYNVFTTLPKSPVTQDNFWSQVKSYRQSLEKIPFVQGEARADLVTASSILTQSDSRKVRFLRAITNLVLMRSTFSDADKIVQAHSKIDWDQNLEAVCKVNWKYLRTWIASWTYFGMELKNDLVLAYPDKKSDFDKSDKFFREARNISPEIEKVCRK